MNSGLFVIFKKNTVKISKGLLVSTIFITSSSYAANDPSSRTLGLVDSLSKVEKNNTASYQKVDSYIDYVALTNNSIKNIRDKFTDKQAETFTQNFRKLIRMVAYPQSSAFYKDAKASYSDAIITGNTALVVSETVIEKEDFEMEIGYQWHKTDADWRMTDLLIDEDSLVKDYQNQFGRIVNKEGVEGLIARINNKIKEVEMENLK